MKKIQVTEPFLPPFSEYQKLIEDIWDRNWLTNNGPILKSFEDELKNYLETENLLVVSNGTIAIQFAIKSLELSGEIITTPFSYVATTSSIVWETCTPVFADIDEQTFNIDPEKVREKITNKTSAILATHVFGNPCDIDALSSIAKEHNLKLIFDAAHAFGSRYKKQSVLNYGDISTLSLHATKLFHCIEGGAICSSNKEVISKITYLRNFGHDGPEKFNGLGINGKNSEFHAAMGLLNLRYAEDILTKRKNDFITYYAQLKDLERISFQHFDENAFNYSYFSLVFESENLCLRVFNRLQENNIFPRRYFYPTLNQLDYIAESKQKTPIADSISSRILCLPLSFQIKENEIEKICGIIREELKL